MAITRGWALSLLKCMGYVKRKASTKTGILSNEEFEQRRRHYLLEISGMVKRQIIPRGACPKLGPNRPQDRASWKVDT